MSLTEQAFQEGLLALQQWLHFLDEMESEIQSQMARARQARAAHPAPTEQAAPPSQEASPAPAATPPQAAAPSQETSPAPSVTPPQSAADDDDPWL